MIIAEGDNDVIKGSQSISPQFVMSPRAIHFKCEFPGVGGKQHKNIGVCTSHLEDDKDMIDSYMSLLSNHRERSFSETR